MAYQYQYQSYPEVEVEDPETAHKPVRNGYPLGEGPLFLGDLSPSVSSVQRAAKFTGGINKGISFLEAVMKLAIRERDNMENNIPNASLGYGNRYPVGEGLLFLGDLSPSGVYTSPTTPSVPVWNGYPSLLQPSLPAFGNLNPPGMYTSPTTPSVPVWNGEPPKERPQSHVEPFENENNDSASHPLKSSPGNGAADANINSPTFQPLHELLMELCPEEVERFHERFVNYMQNQGCSNMAEVKRKVKENRDFEKEFEKVFTDFIIIDLKGEVRLG